MNHSGFVAPESPCGSMVPLPCSSILRLAVHKVAKLSVLEGFAGVGGLGEGIHIAKRFLLPVLSC